MKKQILAIILTLCFLCSINARKNKFFGWFHITPKVGYGTSLLTNKNMFDFNDVSPRAFNGAYSFGAQLGAAFIDKYDLSLEIGQSATNQLYSVSAGELKYDKNLKFTSLDYGIMFKIMSNTGYVEIGAMASNIDEIYIKNIVKIGQEPVFNDNKSYFNKKYYNLVTGFGATIIQVDLFEITLGARCRYGLQPMLTGPELPLLDNVYSGILGNDAKSRNLSLMLELNIHSFFGFFGKAICGSRAILFFQKPKSLW